MSSFEISFLIWTAIGMLVGGTWLIEKYEWKGVPLLIPSKLKVYHLLMLFFFLPMILFFQLMLFVFYLGARVGVLIGKLGDKTVWEFK
ncbi:hypothetical protein PP175_26050 (plasmid) [Aneurinibacillus sp. Ricciae_BoGa-3]|uniref:hypothetical protein n=1 Tax=Aneurinibacillus sp. Ricciae_BoGa-3 TaxID=3022697 RepID=UPI002340B89A|nr:hypothetical protein [Aneurinibacillus sp. Ricciae_BoGa-3]WCK57530.1 hypothetical protein PP175_26050 [Aneurinibacillus sp. Ricciae_BoGa-3]